MFTKQHYQAVADILKDSRDAFESRNWDSTPDEVLTDISLRIADYFAADNPRFRPTQFVAACHGKKMTPRQAKAAEAATA